MNKDRIILGIDPGTIVMGYGILQINGSKITLLASGIFKLDKAGEHFDKLKKIFESLISLIEEYKPDELAIEEPFFGKNVQSMLKLGRAQGAAISAALHREIPVFGYTPRKIKQSITGKGAASKEQVAAMLQQILQFEEAPKYLDATDALGVALCHYYQGNPIVALSTKKTSASKSKKNHSGWEAFLSENPQRINSKK